MIIDDFSQQSKLWMFATIEICGQFLRIENCTLGHAHYFAAHHICFGEKRNRQWWDLAETSDETQPSAQTHCVISALICALLTLNLRCNLTSICQTREKILLVLLVLFFFNIAFVVQSLERGWWREVGGIRRTDLIYGWKRDKINAEDYGFLFRTLVVRSGNPVFGACGFVTRTNGRKRAIVHPFD